MQSFAFRQRVGSFDWKLISGVNIKNVVEDIRLDELQSILDCVTFSEFNDEDVKSNTVQSTTKLVHLMQLMLEYLLFCQESQFQLAKDLHHKNSTLKQKIQNISKDNISLKEDIKIYQRQLTMLRQSIIKYQTIIKNSELSTQNHNPRIVLDLQSLPPQDNKNEQIPIQPIVESMLKHEKETRMFMKEMLEDQRSIFLDELQHVVEKLNTQQYRPTVAEEGPRLQDHTIIREVTAATQKIATEAEKQQQGLKKALQELKEREDHYREAMTEEFRQREAALEEREQQLHELFLSIQDNSSSNNLRSMPALKPMHSSRNVGVNTDPVAIASANRRTVGTSTDTIDTPQPSTMVSYQSLGGTAYRSAATTSELKQLKLRIILNTVRSHGSLSKAVALARWRALVFQMKELELAKLEKESKDRENVLIKQLALEKERVVVEAARYKALLRKMEKEETERQLTKQLAELTAA